MMISVSPGISSRDASLEIRHAEERYIKQWRYLIPREFRRLFKWWLVEVYSHAMERWLPLCNVTNNLCGFRVCRLSFKDAYEVGTEQQTRHPHEEYRIRQVFSRKFVLLKLVTE